MRMANDIQVTGKLGADLKVYNTPAGMVGRMPIYVSTRPNQPDLLYTIEASEGLGPLIDEQLKNCKGAIVNVVGRLRVDPYVDNKTGASRHLLVIEAEQLSVLEGTLELVRRTSSTPSKGQAPPAPATAPAAASPRSASSPPRISSQVQPSGSSKAAGGQSAVTPPGERMTPEREAELWELFSQNRNEFWDNSEKGPMPKKNPKGPDFKNKKTGEALWISSRNAPDWVREL